MWKLMDKVCNVLEKQLLTSDYHNFVAGTILISSEEGETEGTFACFVHLLFTCVFWK